MRRTRRTILPLSLVLLLLPLLAAPAGARGRKTPATAPGQYSEWGGEIDEVEVVQTFKRSDYPRIVVEPFDTKGTPLPERGDNTYEPVRTVLSHPEGPFLEGLAGTLQGSMPVTQGPAGEGPALIVKIRVLKLDPGSRAARYWAGFGAGAARVELAGEIVDAATGKTLLRFRQERRSGSGFDSLGGDYVELLGRSLQAIGKDVAFILAAF